MKQISLFLTLVYFSVTTVWCQQPFWQDNFNNGCAIGCLGSGYISGVNGAWSVSSTGLNGATANVWYVSCAEDGFPTAFPCGGNCQAVPADGTAHVGNVSTSTNAGIICPAGDCGAIYDDTSVSEATDTRLETPIINATNLTGIAFQFNYLLVGNGCANDYLQVQYFDGSIWSTLVNCLPSTGNGCAPQGTWVVNYSVNLPPSATHNPNIRMGFRWVSNGTNSGGFRSVAINDCVMSYTALPLTVATFEVEPVEDKQVSVSWSSAPQADVSTYFLERSGDGKNYQSLEEFKITPSSSSYFSYQDNQPLVGEGWYRIRQVLNSGQTLYSLAEKVNLIAPSGIRLDVPTVYENGISELRPDFYSSVNRNFVFRLFDTTGKTLFQSPSTKLSAGSQNIQLPIPALSAGTYIFQVLPEISPESVDLPLPIYTRLMVR